MQHEGAQVSITRFTKGEGIDLLRVPTWQTNRQYSAVGLLGPKPKLCLSQTWPRHRGRALAAQNRRLVGAIMLGPIVLMHGNFFSSAQFIPTMLLSLYYMYLGTVLDLDLVGTPSRTWWWVGICTGSDWSSLCHCTPPAQFYILLKMMVSGAVVAPR